MDERIFWLGFSQCNGIGPMKFRLLLEYFKSAENAWHASPDELEQSGVGKAAAAKIVSFRSTFSPEFYTERMQKLGINFLILQDATYPALLKQTEKPPFVLYIKGDARLVHRLHDNERVAVVGTRKITEYGRHVTETLTAELAQAGYIIVSGLALGVDAIAHSAALSVHGKTIAVLGSGVDYCTPRENQALYEKILENDGAIVSEVPLGYMPNKGSFPSRNRIIAGISKGVLVTEGAEDSGSLITAEYAFSTNRTVFAVPGPITSTVSQGTNSLITKGAKMVTTAKDIIESLDMHKKTFKRKGLIKIKADTKDEQKLIDLLSNQEMHFDEIVKRTGFDSSHVGTLLSLLEMKGLILPYASGVFGLVQ